MASRYEIDPQRRRLTVVGEGAVTGEEMMAFLRAVLADPAFGPGFDVLLDLCAQTTTPETTDIQRQTQVLAEWGETLAIRRFAAVAPQTVLFGMSRMFIALNDERLGEAQVFRSRDEAERWLGEGG